MICQGFKSFKEPTKINFDKGFSAIVGANGSGKSNILDAFVFALGELSGNKMRVNNVRDLICNGGADGKNTSRAARVDIIFDNSDGGIPIESSEVTLSRKITLKGTGSYYINGRRTTRRELQDLMDLCNLIPNSTNLVLQGELFRIINMTNTERRQIIDEISGIASYDEKKENAERQLEKVEENISRITLLLNEVSIQLDNLEVEKNDALEYKRFDDLQRDLDKTLLIKKIEGITKILIKIKEKKRTIEQEIIQIENNVVVKRNYLSELSEKLDLVNYKISNLESEELIELTQKLNYLKTENAKNETSKAHVTKEINKLKNAQISAINKKAELLNEKTELKKELTVLESEKAGNEQILKVKNENLDAIKQELQKLDSNYVDVQERLEGTRQSILREQETRNTLYSEVKVLENSVNNHEKNKINISKRITKISNELINFEEETIELEERKKKLQDNKRGPANIADFENAKVEIDRELKRIQDIIQEKHTRLISLKSKLKTIKKFNQNRAVEAILKIKDSDEIQGIIYGTILQLGKTNAEYNVALEVAAGGKLQYLVVDSQKTSKECIQYLKRNKIGRASFIPLDKIKVITPNYIIKSNDKVVGRAVDLIQFDQVYRKAFEFVFGRTIIVSDLETAVNLPVNARKVTMKGDVVESSNLMRGGTHQKNNGFSFQTNEESNIKNYEAELEKLKIKERSLINKLREIDMNISEYYKNSIQGNKELNGITQKLNGYQEKRIEKEDEIKSLKLEINDIENEIQKSNEDLSEKSNILNIFNEKLDALKNQEKLLQNELQNSENAKIKNQIQELERDVSRLTENISQIRITLTQIKTKLKDVLVNKIAEIEETILKNEETIEDCLVENESLEAIIETTKEEIKEINAKILEQNQILSEFIKEKNQITKDITDTKIAIEEMKAQIHPKSIQINTYENKLENFKAQLCELQVLFGNNYEEIFTETDISIPEGLKQYIDYSLSKLEELIRDCIEKKTLLEPVNMRAIDKYDKIKKRYDDLIEKHDQVVNERQSIIEFVEKIEADKKEVFLKTFAGINENFSKIFAKLSPSGEAKLELENYEDPFAGGLKIMARPGDKKWCLTQSMSGGEKTLTIIALILGIQQYIPSPYYILDEIDAALDEVNTILVAEMVKELSLNSQFILITHREQTMERTDQLLGISIADGISGVLNINIREALAAIAE